MASVAEQVDIKGVRLHAAGRPSPGQAAVDRVVPTSQDTSRVMSTTVTTGDEMPG